MILRAGHPAAWQVVGDGTNLVRGQLRQQFAPAPEHAHVWAEELVRRARQEIAAERLHVDRPMRGIMDRVGEYPRAGALGLARDRGDVVDRADAVRCEADRDQLRALRELLAEGIEIERAVLGMNVDPAHRRAGIACGQHPRRHVRVVIEPRHHHLVAGPQHLRDRPAQVEGQARHVLAEDDFVRRRRVQEGGHAPMGLLDDGVGVAAGAEDAAVVGVAGRQVMDDRVEHALRHLRASRPVEEDRRTAVAPYLEGGEVVAQSGEIDHVVYSRRAECSPHAPREDPVTRSVTATLFSRQTGNRE